ncbi:DNA-binding GntR family transcriptional regulator [Thermocatellispora tengchongensis]|uniref:DNA-binding GntR family transcriptional regulator n=1 Tax=Thermocatellispora tengchongensis TaxID=1073253 RepID=A0A840PFT0_9ACTN|nr:GntR family transcriptional regulator [Thermocatellispora tengchongensis]MBB5137849.1 DNA-binding GntR family transcriptional regulator [Thermocatellispora tengchongensis]
MARRGTSKTLSGDVYSQLRDAILLGQVRPGERLKPTALREEYDVSISVVREVLTRLAEQRLVVAEPNQGFSVAPLTRAHLEELVEARCSIEGLAIRMSVARGDLEWESKVLAVHHRLEGTPIWLEGPEKVINPEWVSVHAAFHATLLEACGNSIILDVCASLFDMAELYRRWNETGTSTVTRDVAKEHRDLAAAALEHDAELAEKLLVEHIRTTRDMALTGIPALAREAAGEQPA